MADIFDLFKQISKQNTAPTAAPTHIIAGLGNPGKEYEKTRHNAGFMALDHLSAKLGADVSRLKFKALCGEAQIGTHRVLLMKPQTFMNLSGEAVREAAAFYHIEPQNIIVIYDDVNLDVGRLRVRGKGSDGGHNGIKSIIYQLSSDAFPRVRVGVGKKPHSDYDLASWVLSTFGKQEQEKLFATFDTVQKGVELLLAGDLATAMQTCNGVLPC